MCADGGPWCGGAGVYRSGHQPQHGDRVVRASGWRRRGRPRLQPGRVGSEFAGVCAGQVEDVDVGVLGCDAAGDDVALGGDSFRAAGNVEEGDAGGVELLSGFCNGGVFGELIASHRVGGEKRCVAACSAWTAWASSWSSRTRWISAVCSARTQSAWAWAARPRQSGSGRARMCRLGRSTRSTPGMQRRGPRRRTTRRWCRGGGRQHWANHPR